MNALGKQIKLVYCVNGGTNTPTNGFASRETESIPSANAMNTAYNALHYCKGRNTKHPDLLALIKVLFPFLLYKKKKKTLNANFYKGGDISTQKLAKFSEAYD